MSSKSAWPKELATSQKFQERLAFGNRHTDLGQNALHFRKHSKIQHIFYYFTKEKQSLCVHLSFDLRQDFEQGSCKTPPLTLTKKK